MEQDSLRAFLAMVRHEHLVDYLDPLGETPVQALARRLRWAARAQHDPVDAPEARFLLDHADALEAMLRGEGAGAEGDATPHDGEAAADGEANAEQPAHDPPPRADAPPDSAPPMLLDDAGPTTDAPPDSAPPMLLDDAGPTTDAAAGDVTAPVAPPIAPVAPSRPTVASPTPEGLSPGVIAVLALGMVALIGGVASWSVGDTGADADVQVTAPSPAGLSGRWSGDRLDLVLTVAGDTVDGTLTYRGRAVPLTGHHDASALTLTGEGVSLRATRVDDTLTVRIVGLGDAPVDATLTR